jgi:uncharacterized protein YjbI with pentapeptide repeats
MIKFKLFENVNAKKKIALIALLIFALLLILGNYNREVIKSYIDEVVTSPSTRIHLINIAKVAIPLKNLILMRNVDDKIDLLKSSGSCVFCDLTQGNFKGSDLNGVDLRYAILIGANLINKDLTGTILTQSNLTGANLSGVDLSNKDLTGIILTQSNLTGANLSGVDLSNKDLTGIILTQSNLTGANLSGVDLSGKDLTGTTLIRANLSGTNLSGVDLSNKDLTGVNLTGVNLRNKDLTGTILTQSNLTGANLSGVDLSNKDLTGVNLSGVDLSNKDLTGTILKDAKKIEISLNNPSNSNWSALNEIQNLNITRYDLGEDVQYIATKEGFLFESKNNESRLVLDLNNDAQFPFDNYGFEPGLLGIASQNELVYVSYTSQDINELFSLVVDEYSMNFTKVRNIIKIDGFAGHFGGNLLFDSLGKLYLSVGDGFEKGGTKGDQAQNLNSLKGKILRLDVSKLKLEPEIVVYGIRNPWGVTIDSKDRMFILQCGYKNVEAVYLLNDLYSGISANLGWPVFEGSIRNRKDPLMFNDVLAPIFEYTNRPGCVTDGLYLNDIELFLLADFFGTIRLLKQQENGEWSLFHEYKLEEGSIWSFGLDKKTKKIFIAPNNLELEILVDQVKLNQQKLK